MDEPERHRISRRQALGVVGISMAAAVNPIVAQTRAQRTDSVKANDSPLTDPRTKYPKPPFKRQLHPWPGLARDMDPNPDHGETSYRGSGRLVGRKALITGVYSGIGRAAAIAYARKARMWRSTTILRKSRTLRK